MLNRHILQRLAGDFMSTCHRLPHFAAILVLTSIAAGVALAGELPAPFLAQDFAAGADPGYLWPQDFAAIGGKIYFSATDPDQGREPWVSDGSAEGTRRLVDLCLGECGSHPRGFAAIGDAVVFHGTNSLERRAVYRLDADGGIQELASFDYDIPQWAPLGSAVVFATRLSQVYRTDGTSEGTRLIAELHPQPSFELPQEMAAVGGAVYYADAGKLYRITENDETPQPIFDFGESPRTKLFDYTVLDSSRFVFRMCTVHGDSLQCRAWVSDGTGAGTRSLETTPDGLMTASPENFLAWRGRVYFVTYHYPIEPYHRLVSTDGTAEGTRNETMPAEYPRMLAATPGHLFFDTFGGLVARDAAGQDRIVADWGNLELIGMLGERILVSWGESGGSHPPHPGFTRLAVSNGEPEGSFDLREGGSEAGIQLGDSLYFGFFGADGRGLLRSDGSAQGTVLVKGSADVPRSGTPRPFRAGAALAVETNNGNVPGDLLHRLDPQTLSLLPVGDGPLTVTAAGGGRVFLSASTEGEEAPHFSYDGSQLVELPFRERFREGHAFAEDGHLFFFTGGSEEGLRLRESDGSAAGTRVLEDFPPGGHCLPYCAYPGGLAVSGDSLFYHYYVGDYDFRTRTAVWDRSTGESRTLLEGDDFLGAIDGLPGGRALFRQRMYQPEIHEVFWRTDGSAAGTEAFLDFPAAPQVIVSAVAGNRFYLVLPAVHDTGFQGLWAGDLSDAGVQMVVPTADHRFRELLPAGDHLYFVYDSPNGRELGFTDGGAAGTRFFDLRPGPGSSMPQNLFLLDDRRLVFAAAGDGAGLELWISDGTQSGTYRLTDLNPGDAASSPSDFVQAGGRLFFQASDGLHGRELWGLDLPPARPGCPADRLCLQNDRFAVKVTAHAPDGDFPGRRALAGAESGVFTFFSQNNWEMLVKVLDGCGVNDAFWVSAAAASDVGYTLEVLDRASGVAKTWNKTAGAASPILDIAAFPACELAAPEPIHSPALPPAGLAGLCGDYGSDLCLGEGGRYRASLTYHTANGSGPALPVADGSADSGLFTFFSPTNWEMMVKVLDACAINGRVWVLAAGTTDAGWTLKVEDRVTGAEKTYGNPSGRAAPALVDLGAFACD
jgi:ELWxxDGT repeat protein